MEDKVFSGLKVKLKKINPNYMDIKMSGEEQNGAHYVPQIAEHNFIAFGHYDVIQIENVGKLSDFRPGKDLEQRDQGLNNKVSLNNKYYTEYTLKLIAINELKLFKDEYEFWFSGADEDLPYITIVSVDIKDKCLRLNNENDKISQYVDIINNICKKASKDVQEIKIAPYFCLGYTDFVIILRSNSLTSSQKCIDFLRKNDYVSSTYTVFGLKIIRNYKNFSDEKISVRFEWSFKDILIKGKGNRFFEKLLNLNLRSGRTYGVFDNFAEGEISEQDFYQLFSTSNPYFNDKGKAYGIVKNFNTYINLSVNNFSEEIGSENKEKKDELYQCISDALQTFLNEYKILIDNLNSHKRLYKAMQEMGRYYGHIASTCHSGDVQKVFGGFYVEFLQTITYIVQQINKKMLSSENEAVGNRFDIQEIEKLDSAIEEFRNLFGTLLFDILRSDHSFFEAPSVAHPSIGSTTKLLLAYNNIVNGWNSEMDVEDGHHGVSFLVTSGGCDKTKAHNLLYKFEELIPVKGSQEDKIDYKLPVIITISEASLYDIEGTLFRLAHEFFHLKGKRNREERYNAFYEGLFYEYIDYCCYFIEKESYIMKGRMNQNSEDIGEAKKISAIDFKKTFDSSLENYQSLNSFIKGLKNKNEKTTNELKNYANLIVASFDCEIFTPAPAYTEFLKEIYKDEGKVYQSFLKNFTYDGYETHFKAIDQFNDTYSSLFYSVFKDYKDRDYKDKELIQRLKEIFSHIPFDWNEYVKYTSTHIPQMIGELSDIYANIEYNKSDSERKSATVKCGLIYDYYDQGKDDYNVKGFKEYSAECGSGIRYMPPQSEFYARLWIRATIAFFQEEYTIRQDYDSVPFNRAAYDIFVYDLYKECFADACALRSFYKDDITNEDLIALYIAAFIFEHRNVNHFFELFNGPDSIQLQLALRISVIIACITGKNAGEKIDINPVNMIDKIWNRVKDVFKNEGNDAFNKEMISALNKIILIYNGSVDNNPLSGYRNFIYIRKLIEYVQYSFNRGNANINHINYPDFKSNDDYLNIKTILNHWLDSYSYEGGGHER